MIVYDREQKEIVIPNGIGNINLFNNGVEAGYNQGKIDGIEEQKSKLESIIIINNGTYRKEDGYNKIVVDVPDLNGSYDEGYKQGLIDMESNARVLNVTENGVYRSKYSDDMPPIAYTVTGVYADGTEFHSCAELNGKVFNTKIAGSIDRRLEFWYKGDYTLSDDVYNVIIGAGNNDNSNTFQVRYFVENNNIITLNLGNSGGEVIEWDETVWHHLIVSKAEGIWIDGEKKGDLSPTNTVNGEFFINGINYDVKLYDGGKRNANGYFGMIKIDDTIIIPTADGFKNVNTGELLEVVKDGGYTFRENDPIYGEGELYKTINVNVPDLNGSYDEGYAQGKTDGINEQKGKLESINITENGTYTKEDGYNHIEVNVPDLNGSYDEGYAQGQADVAANARVLNVTENGNYLSKFSDPIVPELVTGVYADGTEFYNYAELNGKVFNTQVIGNQYSRVELWYKGDNELSGDAWNVILGCGKNDDISCYQIRYYSSSNNEVSFQVGYSSKEYTWDENAWHHIVIAKEEETSSSLSLWIDDEKIYEYGNVYFDPQSTFYINGIEYNGGGTRTANGWFGMIKIDDTIIIPTAEGFKNVNTGELLEVVKDGSYVYTNNEIIQGEGELYKTINVNVLPKINLKKTGLKLGFSTFTEVPEWVDFEGITNMSNMFNNCGNLQTIPQIDTSKVTDMSNMFNSCFGLRIIPLLNTSNVTNANGMFCYCRSLKTLPNNFNFGNCNNLAEMFNSAGLTDYSFLETWVINPNANMDGMIENTNTTYVPAIPCVGNTSYFQSAIFWAYGDYSKLTYFGGWIGRKYNITQDYILKKMTALSYESCISILNNLYDFTGNGETPNSEQGQLKVAQSFIDKVGDEISIATSKGWVVSV